MILHDQKLNHPRQDLRYNTPSVDKINKSLQFSNFTRNRELNRLTQTTVELKFEVIVNFAGLYPHPLPTSTQTKH